MNRNKWIPTLIKMHQLEKRGYVFRNKYSILDSEEILQDLLLEVEYFQKLDEKEAKEKCCADCLAYQAMTFFVRPPSILIPVLKSWSMMQWSSSKIYQMTIN